MTRQCVDERSSTRNITSQGYKYVVCKCVVPKILAGTKMSCRHLSFSGRPQVQTAKAPDLSDLVESPWSPFYVVSTKKDTQCVRRKAFLLFKEGHSWYSKKDVPCVQRRTFPCFRRRTFLVFKEGQFLVFEEGHSQTGKLVTSRKSWW